VVQFRADMPRQASDAKAYQVSGLSLRCALGHVAMPRTSVVAIWLNGREAAP